MTEVVVRLPFEPRPWQLHCARKLKRFSVLVVHRRAGKTVFAVMRLIDQAIRNRRESPRYAYVAPLFKQAKDIAWDYLRRYAHALPGSKVNESETWVELPTEGGSVARIRIYGADNPDALRGIYLDGAVMDEVAQMKPEVWDEILLPALTDRQGWALFIGTPKGINRFSEMYDRARITAGWFAALYDVHQTDALPEAEIELARREMPEGKFRQEYLCDFSAANEDSLLSLDAVMAAKGRNLVEPQYRFAPKILGVDVARQGDDRSVIIRRQGLASFTPQKMRERDTMRVAGRVAAEIKAWQPDAVMVDGTGGYGASVIDRLRQMGYTIIEVQFGSRADDARYQNKRAEMYWRLKEWIDAGGALPPDDDLVRELCALTTANDNARGVLALESKDAIKERLGVSPDVADALACTFAYDVAPPPMLADGTRLPDVFGEQESYATPRRESEVYNPLR